MVCRDYFEVDVKDFKEFISQLNNMEVLSLKESSAINVLPVYKDEEINFRVFLRMETLRKWISIIKSEDLIYILDNNQLTTFFQPLVDIKNHSIFGYELLSRGIKEDGSIMSPNDMFSISRESELTFNLDRQARIASIKNAAKENITNKLFINFLPSVVYNPSVCLKTTIDLIYENNLNPENITFEVVETEDVKEIDHLVNILDFYRKQGFTVALDDLGSGYSSLNNLSKLYPDYIKIDMHIIRDIDKNKLNQEIFEALVSIANNIDISVLAEGVETQEELDFVTSKGADLVQGYIFGKPSASPLMSL